MLLSIMGLQTTMTSQHINDVCAASQWQNRQHDSKQTAIKPSVIAVLAGNQPLREPVCSRQAAMSPFAGMIRVSQHCGRCDSRHVPLNKLETGTLLARHISVCNEAGSF